MRSPKLTLVAKGASVMTGPQVFENVLQNILASIPKLVDVVANDSELIEEQLNDQLPGFTPNGEELIHLVKFWLKIIMGLLLIEWVKNRG